VIRNFPIFVSTVVGETLRWDGDLNIEGDQEVAIDLRTNAMRKWRCVAWMAIVLYPDPMVSRTLGRLENMLIIVRQDKSHRMISEHAALPNKTQLHLDNMRGNACVLIRTDLKMRMLSLTNFVSLKTRT
jgi:hypothetical protein